MSVNKIFSVCMPFLGDYESLFLSIENCLGMEIVGEVIVFEKIINTNFEVEIHKRFNGNPKIILILNQYLDDINLFHNLINKSESDFLSFILPGEIYISEAFNKSLKSKLKEEKIKILCCNANYTDTKYEYTSTFSSVSQISGLTAFENGLILCTSSLLFNKDYLLTIKISFLDINLVSLFNIYLQVSSKYRRSIVNLNNNIIKIPKKTIGSEVSIYETNWKLVSMLANVLLINGSKDITIYLKVISKELFYLFNYNALKEFIVYADLNQFNNNLLIGVKKILDSLIFEFQKKENLSIKNMPKELSLFLKNRPDLIALKFHEKKYERKFCLWIVKYGFVEARYFFRSYKRSKSVLDWLSKSSSDMDSDLSRISQAVWDSSKFIRFFWRKPFKRQRFEFFLKLIWPIIPLNLPPKKYFFIKNKYKKSLFSRINFIKYLLINSKGPLKEGVNLIGYAKHSLGIGEDLRTTYMALNNAKVSTSILNFNPGSCKKRYDNSLRGKINSSAPYNTTLVCLTAEETIRFIRKYGLEFFKGRYVIGYWPWELPKWPSAWLEAIDFVNEIWVSTEFIKDGLDNCTDKPVKVMPLCVDEKDKKIIPQNLEQTINNRSHFGLEIDKTYCIMGFDLNSYIERKNPFGALNCFQRAFPPNNEDSSSPNVGLIVKTYPNNKLNRKWELFKHLVSTDKRIIIIEENMPKQKVLDLFGCCDVYISLHRSEGFGRCIAESLLLGLDVLATNWSGNADYGEGPLYHPVNYSLQDVKPGDYPYWPFQKWAYPDIDLAVEKLKEIVRNRYKNKQKWDYAKKFSAENCGQRYLSRLRELGLINE